MDSVLQFRATENPAIPREEHLDSVLLSPCRLSGWFKWKQTHPVFESALNGRNLRLNYKVNKIEIQNNRQAGLLRLQGSMVE